MEDWSTKELEAFIALERKGKIPYLLVGLVIWILAGILTHYATPDASWLFVVMNSLGIAVLSAIVWIPITAIVIDCNDGGGVG